MNKDSWEVLKKDLKKILIQERLLYLREILKNVKEKAAVPENGEAGLRYNASQEIEKANIYGRQQKRPYNTATRVKDSSVDMIREGEKRREESYRTTKSSLLGQESTKRRKDEDEEKYR